MKKLLAITVFLALVLQTSGLYAQGQHIGVYADPEGRSSCATIEAGGFGILYVLATPPGSNDAGIAGAEFRIEVRAPEGWSFSFHPAATGIVLGDPLDVRPGDASDASGATMAFPTCQEPQAPSGKIALGTIQVLNHGGGPTDLWVKRRTKPSNKLYSCPLVLDCTAPAFYKYCLDAHIAPTCTDVGRLSYPEEDCDRDPVLAVAAINKAVELPPPPDRAPRHPEREVLAMMTRRTTIELPSGRTYATLDETRIHAPAVEAVLRQHAVQIVSKGFPCFDLADTLCGAGPIVRCTDWSLLYKFLLPADGVPRALARELEALTEVVFAHPNGTASVTEWDFSPPNPMRSGSRMTLELTQPERVTLDFYDVAGRRVRRLQDGDLPPGEHVWIWDGWNDHGKTLPSGVYFVRLTRAGNSSHHKVVLLD